MEQEGVKTTVLRVRADAPELDVIAQAAQVIRNGGLAAFPTETVYGLGANALDAEAVSKIFAAKGRPANNPLIVHLPDAASILQVAAAWPEAAEKLAERFWPGPLTLALPKRDHVPDVVTAGGPTVAVRVPAHPVALALLRAAGVPIAAPSANRSEELSPTRAQHVLRSLNGRIDLILDGGPTTGGLESTVLNLTTDPPTLLRPGLIAPAEIEAVIGPIQRPGTTASAQNADAEALLSPGMMHRHYAPRAPLELSEGSGLERVKTLLAQGETVGWLTLRHLPVMLPRLFVFSVTNLPADYARMLYAWLHNLDNLGVTRIVVELPPDTDEWLAVRDRLQRAAV